jgi:hypothetical protein
MNNIMESIRELICSLPEIKKKNVKFFLDGSVKENYDVVQVLSSLGVYSGIVINENADWERLTDLMYYALCGRVLHAPIEPFQYVYDRYERNNLVDYGTVFLEEEEAQKGEGAKGRKGLPSVLTDGREIGRKGEGAKEEVDTSWQRFFYEGTPCAACAGWRICLGKYAGLEDKTGCQNFTLELLNLIESIKYPPKNLKSHIS